MEFVIGAIFMGVIWFIVSIKRQKQKVAAFRAIDVIEPWLIEQGFSFQHFSTHDDSMLARNDGATILIGDAKNSDDEYVGFVAEVAQERLIEGALLRPYGIASRYREAALEAKDSGRSLIDVLQDYEKRHQLKYGQPSKRIETPVHTAQDRKKFEPIPPMPSFPDYTSATPTDQLKISGYQALLFRNIPPIAANLMDEGNCLQFLFALVVVNDEQKPIYVVTSEITDIKHIRNRMSDIFDSDDYDRASDIFDLLNGSNSSIRKPMLCTFTAAGHSNFGNSEDWSDKESFLKKAKTFVEEALG